MHDVEKTLFTALVATAGADGQISPEERAWLREILKQAGLKAEVSLDHAPPLDRDALRRALAGREDRVAFLKIGLMVAMSDGTVSAPEYDFLKSLAQDLEVSEADLEDLRHETILAVEPGD